MNHASGRFARVLVHSAIFGVSLSAIFFSGALAAQTREGGMAQGMLKQKLETIKASAAENQAKLHQYTWTETSNITVNGRAMPPKESTASYGPDGKVHKVPIGGTQDAPAGTGRGGRLMARIKENKKAETTDYMQQVGHVISMYVPPTPQKMQQAFEAKKVSFDHANGMADLVFKDYALPGDSMTVAFDTATRKIRSIHVKSYLDTPQDAVMLNVQFATLPDGTNHPARTTLDATGKDIHVVNTNSNYRKTGQS
ncbi:MAG: hypothetical protein ACREPF_00815 [Rhodanobacteraceae bacterium]